MEGAAGVIGCQAALAQRRRVGDSGDCPLECPPPPQAREVKASMSASLWARGVKTAS